MSKERILIVEDEQIVAEDLRVTLDQMGYEVVGLAASGDEALKAAQTARPDLVLMDIRLGGDMDGIQAAEQITAQFNIPVTYLTADADESTLQRAKLTMPFGYILKPFEERDLRTSIEVALYKANIQKLLRSMEEWHAAALEHLPEVVMAIDLQGRVVFMNAEAEKVTGWKLEDVFQQPLEALLEPPQELVASSGKSKKIDWKRLSKDTPIWLRQKAGHRLAASCRSAVVTNTESGTAGLLLVFRCAAESLAGSATTPK